MKEKNSSPLVVMFTDEERAILKRISQRDGRAEGPEVKWLLRQYAEGMLKPISEVGMREHNLESRIAGIYEEIMLLRRAIGVKPPQASAAPEGTVVDQVDLTPEDMRKIADYLAVLRQKFGPEGTKHPTPRKKTA